MTKNVKKVNSVWYDNPNFISNLIIGLILVIVVFSQSFAFNGESSIALFGSIINHNTIYILVLIYFTFLKTKFGKKYFNYFNLFLLFIYFLSTITSFLTVVQAFSLSSAINFMILCVLSIYLSHTLLRDTRIWKDFNLGESPFYELSNDWYFYCLIVLSSFLLVVKLISVVEVSGVFISILDCLYVVVLGRFVFLYRDYLDSKKKDIDNNGNFDEIKELVKDTINDTTESVKNFVENNDIDDKLVDLKDKVLDTSKEIIDKVIDNNDDNVEKTEIKVSDKKKKKRKKKINKEEGEK